MIEKQQYFELVNLLNKSNKAKNQTTDFNFFIEDNRLYFGLPNQQRLLIAIRNATTKWSVARATKLFELEDFITHLLNVELSDVNQVNELIKSSLFQTSLE